MPGYHERLRSLDGTRYLLRDFAVYGFRTREQYAPASARTYDNERRRAEGILGGALSWAHDAQGKRLFFSADASALLNNPLHGMYRLCTFTDNDLILHFFILDALSGGRRLDLNEITDAVCARSDRVFEVQTVRRKLGQYVDRGLLGTEKEGKRLLYRLDGPTLADVFPLAEEAADFLSFFREALPFGCLANEMMMRAGWENRYLRFKHHFLMYTLDDVECVKLLAAIREKRPVVFEMEGKADRETACTLCALPVCVRVSEATGRRYLIAWDLFQERTRSFRLDLLHNAEPDAPIPDADAIIERVKRDVSRAWGVALPSGEQLEYLGVTLRIDETKEGFLLDRLRREGRNGYVTRIGEQTYRFEAFTANAAEMMSWVKTFTGRIVSVTSANRRVVERFYEDMRRMAEMYCEDQNSDGTV